VSTIEKPNPVSLALSAAAEILRPVATGIGLDIEITLKDLQVLYWLRSQHPLTKPAFFQGITEWVGTGRSDVAQREPMSSAPSLLDRLLRDGLLWEMGSPTKRVLVSPKGIALLSRLHPSFEDLDLPSRVDRWVRDWPASQNDVQRYVRSLYALQRTYAPS
jgi:hypothetical protein